jgi:hypothetical protein
MPVLEPITHPSTIAGEALGKIIEAIITGEFKPGERIPEAEKRWKGWPAARPPNGSPTRSCCR